MRIQYSASLLLLIIALPSHANYFDRLIAKNVCKSAVYVVTQYPIIFSTIAIVLFRHELCRLLADSSLVRLMGEFPKTSFVIGLIALEIAAMVISSS